ASVNIPAHSRTATCRLGYPVEPRSASSFACARSASWRVRSAFASICLRSASIRSSSAFVSFRFAILVGPSQQPLDPRERLRDVAYVEE
ncbi:MAG TPA: hypothetical protein VIU44_15115, partial [Gaiellaceae bacterium]